MYPNKKLPAKPPNGVIEFNHATSSIVISPVGNGVLSDVSKTLANADQLAEMLMLTVGRQTI